MVVPRNRWIFESLFWEPQNGTPNFGKTPNCFFVWLRGLSVYSLTGPDLLSEPEDFENGGFRDKAACNDVSGFRV